MKGSRERAQVLNSPISSHIKLAVNDRVEGFTNEDTIEDTIDSANKAAPTQLVATLSTRPAAAAAAAT